MRRTLYLKTLRVGSDFWRPGLLAIMVWGVLLAGCGDDSAPVGTVALEDGDPDAGLELSGAKPTCSARNTGGPIFPGGPTVPRLIELNFASSALEKYRKQALELCSQLLRERETEIAVELAALVEERSVATMTQQIQLINAFLCLAESKPAGGPGCSFQVPTDLGEGENFSVVGSEGTDGPVESQDGFSAYELKPGWSEEPRIVTYEVLPDGFTLNFDGPQFPVYRRYGTIPAGPFAPGGSGLIFQCVILPDGYDDTFVRLAKNFEQPDDSLGTFVPFAASEDPDDGIEYFENPPPSETFSPPECDESPTFSQAAAPRSLADGAGVQRDSKKGGSGIELAVTRKSIGGTVSSFSEWGFVDISSIEEPALSFVTCTAGEGLCLEDPVVSIEGNVIAMGTADAPENGSLNTSVHGGAALLPPASEYVVTVQHDLCTWDSYNTATETEAGTGFFDSFSVSVSQDEPYWLKEVSDPVSDAMLGLPGALGFGPGGGRRFGDGILEGATEDGAPRSCSAAEGAPETVTLTMPGNPLTDNYLNIVLDTASLPQANHSFPSWGTVTVLSVDTGE